MTYISPLASVSTGAMAWWLILHGALIHFSAFAGPILVAATAGALVTGILGLRHGFAPKILSIVGLFLGAAAAISIFVVANAH